MKIYYSPDDFARLDCAVVTSGTFDGVHVGHQKILHRLKEIAVKSNGETVVITFWPHPRLLLKPDDQTLKLLNTFEEKAELLKDEGVQHLLRIPFTREFSEMSSTDFISNVLVRTIGTKKLVIGYDHRFGRNREGSFEELRRNGPALGFDVEEIPRQEVDHLAVSSSKIRHALENGDVQTATHLLGRPYSISGRVIKGDGIGRTLGYPTANIDIDSHYKLVPAHGIYAVCGMHERKSYGGMLYIGTRPTLDSSTPVIEVNLFGFHQDIYGQTLKLDIIDYLRGDIRFDGLDTLKVQLAKDQQASERILRQQNLI